MTREERVEAAARAYAIASAALAGIDSCLHDDAEWERAKGTFHGKACMTIGKAVVEGAFPDLFSDPPTAWVAPWEATEAMEDESDAIVEAREHVGLAMKSAGGWIFAAMRDAHLEIGDAPK